MDLLVEIRNRVMGHVACEVTRARIAAELDAVRRDWGGERPYIAVNGEGARATMSRRDAALLRDWQAGERVALLARRYGISRRRVWQIIRGQ